MEFFGVDFSINHTGVFYISEDKIKSFTISREGSFTKKQIQIISDLEKTGEYENVWIKKAPKVLDYSEQQHINLEDARDITLKIFEVINKTSDIKTVKVSIEGFAYSSLGQRTLEIAGYSYLLRNILLENKINFTIYSPGQIKKFAGKGNFNKIQMLDAFIEDKDKFFGNKNKIYTYIKSNRDSFVNKNNVIEPLSGIVDSAFIARINQK